MSLQWLPSNNITALHAAPGGRGARRALCGYQLSAGVAPVIGKAPRRCAKCARLAHIEPLGKAPDDPQQPPNQRGRTAARDGRWPRRRPVL